MRLKILAAATAFAALAFGSAAQAQSSFDLLAESVDSMQRRLWGTWYSEPLATQIGILASSQHADFTITPSSAGYGTLQAYATCGGCSDIDLFLWDAYERTWVAQDNAVDPTPSFRHTPVPGRSYVIRVSMYDCPINSCWYTMTAVR